MAGMVERVARAICAEDERQSDCEGMWSEAVYLPKARAAIEAMQPTPAMVEAACLALHSDNYRKAGDKYREPMFRDMTEALHAAFAAALSDKDGS